MGNAVVLLFGKCGCLLVMLMYEVIFYDDRWMNNVALSIPIMQIIDILDVSDFCFDSETCVIFLF